MVYSSHTLLNPLLKKCLKANEVSPFLIRFQAWQKTWSGTILPPSSPSHLFTPGDFAGRRPLFTWHDLRITLSAYPSTTLLLDLHEKFNFPPFFVFDLYICQTSFFSWFSGAASGCSSRRIIYIITYIVKYFSFIYLASPRQTQPTVQTKIYISPGYVWNRADSKSFTYINIIEEKSALKLCGPRVKEKNDKQMISHRASERKNMRERS